MKIIFWENEFGSGFEMEPETTEEVAALLRMTTNTSAERCHINLYYSGNPAASVWLKKKKKAAQRTMLQSGRRC